MDIQKLEKLNELKEKGVISQAEFDAQKQEIMSESSKEESKPKKSKTSIVLQAIGGLFILSIVVSVLSAGQLPECNNKELLKGDLLGAIENIPALRLLEIKPIFAENAIERSYDKDKKIRKCEAHAHFSNGGESDISYTLSVRGDQMLIQAQIKE